MKAITRLRSAFPPLANQVGDADEQLRNYLLAVEDWAADDVDAAVETFIKGAAPGHDGRFVPTAPMLGAQCRREAEARARQAALDRMARPALPPPDIEHSEESRARIKALVAGCVASLTSITADEDEAREREKAERWQRTNETFVPDMDEDAMRERLCKRQGWDVGDPDGDRDVA